MRYIAVFFLCYFSLSCIASTDPLASQFPDNIKQSTATQPPRWAFIPKEAMTQALKVMQVTSSDNQSNPQFSVDFPGDASDPSHFFTMENDQ